jgi:hypothetical protein
MHRNVELLLGRLATDPELRRRFSADPRALLLELVERGMELTRVEMDALAGLDPESIGALANVLDRRLRRVATTTTDPDEAP